MQSLRAPFVPAAAQDTVAVQSTTTVSAEGALPYSAFLQQLLLHVRGYSIDTLFRSSFVTMGNIRRRVHLLLGQVVGPPLDWFADHLDDEQAWKLYLLLPRLLFWQPRLARDADRDFSKVLLRRLQLFQQCEFKELEEQFQRAERDIKQPKPTLAEVAAEEDTQDAAAVDPLFNKVGKVVRSGEPEQGGAVAWR